jgi:hypothetical protein
MADESDQALEYQEAMRTALSETPIAIPLFERAEIRPRELAALRGKLSQAEGEVDYYHDVIHTLLYGLGFDMDWASTQGAKDALKDICKIAAGEITRKEFGDVAADTVPAVLFEMRKTLDVLELCGFKPYFEDGLLVGFQRGSGSKGAIYKPFRPDLEAYYDRDDGLG